MHLSAGITVTACLVLCTAGAADSITASWDTPVLDRWMYPFNPTPGTRILSSTFGATGDPSFDNRDGQMLIGFMLDDQVPPGQGSSQYEVHWAQITIQVSNHLIVHYDNTSDPYQTFLPEDDPEWFPDDDIGEPFELFGAGYRNGYTPGTFAENSPYSESGPSGQYIRNVYAADVNADGEQVDVSNNVDERFNPTPWAVGIIDTLTPGELIPAESEVVFDINIDDPAIAASLQEALDTGYLAAVLSSLTRVEQQGGNFPLFYNREHPDVIFNFVSAARLELSVDINEIPACPEDIDEDGTVGFTDLLALLSSWGDCAGCPGDVNGDDAIDFQDILAILSAWGPC